MGKINGYFIFKIFEDGHIVSVKYLRQPCLVATTRGLIHGYIFTPMDEEGILPVSVTTVDAEVMFQFVREDIETTISKKVH